MGSRLPAGIPELADAEAERRRQGCIEGGPKLLLLGSGGLHRSPIWTLTVNETAVTVARSVGATIHAALYGCDQHGVHGPLRVYAAT